MAVTFAGDRAVPPGPRALPAFGNFLEFRRNPLRFFTRLARTYGDVVKFAFGTQPAFLVSHPDLIEDVLVLSSKKFMKGIALQRAKKLLGEGLLTSEGQMHLRQRRTIQPLFHRQQVQRFAEAMVTHAGRWRESIADGATIDVTAHMGALTLAIVGETLFATDVQGDAAEVREALTDAVDTFAYAVLPGIEAFEKLPVGPWVKVRKARARLDRVILRVIAQRRAERSAFAQGASADRGDLISMLLAARDPENPTEAGMTDAQIRDEAMTIFLAGHETTANAMAWTWHLLGSAPAVDARLIEELTQVLDGREPAVDDVPKLEYARAVIAESMRLYPPAWTMGRRALESHTLGGYEIPKGSLVLASQWVVHRDARWWDEPEAFRPERWLNADAGSREPGAGNRDQGLAGRGRPKFSYFPFGGGNRVCIGESFAWTEAILLLATIAQRWTFVPVSGPRVVPRITLRPADLQMRALRR